MSNSIFRFKHFFVDQSGATQKIGTDAVLLGAWASLPKGQGRILDVGTGTGVIAMQLAYRFALSHVTAIDISSSAASCAQKNFSSSPFSSRMSVRCVSYQEFSSEEKYDLIVSNPPYFIGSIHSSKPDRELSRNNDFLPFDVLDGRTRELLAPAGRFAVILPVREYGIFLTKTLMHPVRECFVSSREGEPPRRVMAELVTFPLEREPSQMLAIYDADGNFTAPYKHLTGDFYLAF